MIIINVLITSFLFLFTMYLYIKYRKFINSILNYFYKENEEFEQTLKDEIQNVIKNADLMVDEKMKELSEKNTLYFDCPCGYNKKIPCFIDFTKEKNIFVCPNCGTAYWVAIQAKPIKTGQAVIEEE